MSKEHSGGGMGFMRVEMKRKDGGLAFPSSHDTGDGVRWHDGMTLQQYAAIKLRVPNSGTEWLDAMIRESMRDELAAKTMQSYFADPRNECLTSKEIATAAYEATDAMLKTREVRA